MASRRSRWAAFSVPRPVRRLVSSDHDGGFKNTNRASGQLSRTCRAPCRSISRIASRPCANVCSTGARGVPYLAAPWTTAHSSSSPRAISCSNSSVRRRTGSAGRRSHRPGAAGWWPRPRPRPRGRRPSAGRPAVPLPTPAGPEMTVSRAAASGTDQRLGVPGYRAIGAASEGRGLMRTRRLALPSGVCPIHEAAGWSQSAVAPSPGRPDDADPGQRLEDVVHLRVGDHVVGESQPKDLGQAYRARPQPQFNLRAPPTRFGCGRPAPVHVAFR